MDSFPLLSVMAYAPLAGALILFFVPRASLQMTRSVALVCSLISFALSVIMLGAYEKDASFQFEERVTWLNDLGVSYHMGVDGIAVLLIGLTTLLSVIAIIWSWDTVTTRTREYYIAMLLLETGMLGVFMALDLFLFYIFWEVMLIPMALLIGVWGSSNRVYAAVKFFLYTLAGSLLMLVGIVATYQKYFETTGVRTLNILELQTGWDKGAYSDVFQGLAFAAFLIAFAVKVPMFPLHTWLPDAHVEAPTAASVILAAVLLKMGGYGMLRFNLPLFPEGAEDWAVPIVVLSVIAVLYGAFVALVQPDLKKLVAYSSVSHMGFVTLGIFVAVLAAQRDRLAGVANVEQYLNGLNGSMMVMLAHGFNTGALFLLVGVIYERAHTRLIAAFGGLASRMPVYSAFFMLFMLASIGLPGLSGFVGEFLVALGTWQWNKWAAFFTFAVVIFAAWYMMWMFQRVIFGRRPEQPPDPHDAELTPEERALLAGHGQAHAPMPVSGASHGHDEHGGGINWRDLTTKEAITLIPLAIATIVAGVYPKPIFEILQPSFERILQPFLRGPLGG